MLWSFFAGGRRQCGLAAEEAPVAAAAAEEEWTAVGGGLKKKLIRGRAAVTAFLRAAFQRTTLLPLLACGDPLVLRLLLPRPTLDLVLRRVVILKLGLCTAHTHR